MNKVMVFNYNPNGTNDIEILDENNEVIDSLPEALFGLNIGRVDMKVIPFKTCLQHVAFSPISDGTETINFLKKYFKVNL
jgi:hypothetical protein